MVIAKGGPLKGSFEGAFDNEFNGIIKAYESAFAQAKDNTFGAEVFAFENSFAQANNNVFAATVTAIDSSFAKAFTNTFEKMVIAKGTSFAQARANTFTAEVSAYDNSFAQANNNVFAAQVTALDSSFAKAFTNTFEKMVIAKGTSFAQARANTFTAEVSAYDNSFAQANNNVFAAQVTALDSSFAKAFTNTFKKMVIAKGSSFASAFDNTFKNTVEARGNAFAQAKFNTFKSQINAFDNSFAGISNNTFEKMVMAKGASFAGALDNKFKDEVTAYNNSFAKVSKNTFEKMVTAKGSSFKEAFDNKFKTDVMAYNGSFAKADNNTFGNIVEAHEQSFAQAKNNTFNHVRSLNNAFSNVSNNTFAGIIEARDTSFAQAKNNVFKNGLTSFDNSFAKISNNTFEMGEGGIGAYNQSFAQAKNNVFKNGLTSFDNSFAKISNNTFAGAIETRGTSFAQAKNNIFKNGISAYDNSFSNISNNTFEMGEGGIGAYNQSFAQAKDNIFKNGIRSFDNSFSSIGNNNFEWVVEARGESFTQAKGNIFKNEIRSFDSAFSKVNNNTFKGIVFAKNESFKGTFDNTFTGGIKPSDNAFAGERNNMYKIPISYKQGATAKDADLVQEALGAISAKDLEKISKAGVKITVIRGGIDTYFNGSSGKAPKGYPNSKDWGNAPAAAKDTEAIFTALTDGNGKSYLRSGGSVNTVAHELAHTYDAAVGRESGKRESMSETFHEARNADIKTFNPNDKDDRYYYLQKDAIVGPAEAYAEAMAAQLVGNSKHQEDHPALGQYFQTRWSQQDPSTDGSEKNIADITTIVRTEQAATPEALAARGAPPKNLATQVTTSETDSFLTTTQQAIKTGSITIARTKAPDDSQLTAKLPRQKGRTLELNRPSEADYQSNSAGIAHITQRRDSSGKPEITSSNRILIARSDNTPNLGIRSNTTLIAGNENTSEATNDRQIASNLPRQGGRTPGLKHPSGADYQGFSAGTANIQRRDRDSGTPEIASGNRTLVAKSDTPRVGMTSSPMLIAGNETRPREVADDNQIAVTGQPRQTWVPETTRPKVGRLDSSTEPSYAANRRGPSENSSNIERLATNKTVPGRYSIPTGKVSVPGIKSMPKTDDSQIAAKQPRQIQTGTTQRSSYRETDTSDRIAATSKGRDSTPTGSKSSPRKYTKPYAPSKASLITPIQSIVFTTPSRPTTTLTPVSYLNLKPLTIADLESPTS